MSRPARRIALILTEFPPSFGGMQTHAVALAAALQAGGDLIEVYTYRLDQPELAESAARFDEACPYVVHRVLSRVSFWHNHRWLVRALDASKPDLVYASNVYYGLLGDVLGIPVLCRSAGNDVQRPWIAYPFQWGSSLVSLPALEAPLHRLYRRCNTPEWLEALLRRARQSLAVRAARGNELILANSQYTAGLLRAAGVARIRTLAGGVDVSRFQHHGPTQVTRATYGIPPHATVLMTACRLVAKKGIDFLLRTLPLLRANHPSLHLLIVGDGRERKRCETLVNALGMASHVTFAGRVPQEDIQHYYALADVFVLASRVSINRVSGLCDAETMGRVLCEANAAGVPVLAARSGGIPSVVRDGDNGLLFESDNAHELARQLERLLRDDALRARLVARGLTRAASEFDWRIIVAAHLQAFDEALENGGLPDAISQIRPLPLPDAI
ncbi:glycosyltransferase family 4 protein [Chitinibacteraceae bacterium HSL-7]